jgi:hypothetical protein
VREWRRHGTLRSATPESANCSVIAAPATGNALVITSLVVDGYGLDSAVSSPYIALFTGPSDCSGPLIDYFDFKTNESRSMDFAPGLVVRSGQSLAGEGFGMTGAIHASGYTVPASAVPASSALAPSGAAPPQRRRP